jgi:hypothetical protein
MQVELAFTSGDDNLKINPISLNPLLIRVHNFDIILFTNRRGL